MTSIRERAITDQIAQAVQIVRPACIHIGKDRFQRGQIAVNVAQNRDVGLDVLSHLFRATQITRLNR